MRSWPMLLAAALLAASHPVPSSAQDVSAEPSFGDVELDEGFLPDPHAVSVTSGGSIDLDLAGCDYGYVSTAPDVDLYYTTTGGASLYVYVEGEDDTTLLVNRPDGNWICDDDSHGGLNPLVTIPAASDGLYNIWVGSYSDRYEDVTLFISEIDPGASTATSGAPDISLEPTYGDVELDEGFLPDPYEVSLRAGGSLEVDVGSCSYGYVAQAPDIDLYYTTAGGSDLHIYVESDDDTTLLVNRPDGNWTCDDDGHEGLNPLVTIPSASQGLYNIWVGTYGDDLTDATLHISELDPD